MMERERVGIACEIALSLIRTREGSGVFSGKVARARRMRGREREWTKTSFDSLWRRSTERVWWSRRRLRLFRIAPHIGMANWSSYIEGVLGERTDMTWPLPKPMEVREDASWRQRRWV